MAKIVYRQMPAPRELPQQIPTPWAKGKIQKPQGGGKFWYKSPEVRGGTVMAKIDSYINRRHLLPAIAFIPNTKKSEMLTYSKSPIYRVLHLKIFGVVGPFGENLDLFNPLGFDVQANSDNKTQKIKIYSVRAFNAI